MRLEVGDAYNSQDELEAGWTLWAADDEGNEERLLATVRPEQGLSEADQYVLYRILVHGVGANAKVAEDLSIQTEFGFVKS